MISNSKFHLPMSGDTAIYYCPNCKKNFPAKVPGDKLIFPIGKPSRTVKCPTCKKRCSLSPMIHY